MTSSHGGELAGLRVLLAEDDATNQLVVRAILQRAGADARVVSDGGQAVRACAAEAFDAVLMDVRMPGMDGLAATRAIRAGERRGGRRHCVIGLTAAVAAEDERACRQAGMDDVLGKPVSRDRLVRALALAAFSHAG